MYESRYKRRHTDRLANDFKPAKSGRFLISKVTHDALAEEEKAAACVKAEGPFCEQPSSENSGNHNSASSAEQDIQYVDESFNNKKFDGLTMPIFDALRAVDYLEGISNSIGDKDEQRRNKSLVEHLKSEGSHRKLAVVGLDCQTRLDSLEADFPNFSDVIKYLRSVVAIALADDCTAQPAYILLEGAPGIGKTEFSKCLADIFRTQLHIAHLETMQNSGDLVGSSEHYSNAKTGAIFNALIGGDFANPMFLLDEIDKASGDDRFPMSQALYQLLEKTSENFCDGTIPWLELDASRIMYVATANDVTKIDAPLLSRLRHFKIDAPSPDQTRQIIENIFSQFVGTRPKALSHLVLTEGAFEKLEQMSPRKIKRAMEMAAGNVLLEARSRICDFDIESEPRKRQSIGFVS